MKKHHLFPSKYIKFEDLSGRDWPVVIASISQETVGSGADAALKPIVKFRNVQKGLVLNATNFDSIALAHGDDTDAWVGKPVTLYGDRTRFGGKIVDCVRVRATPPRPQLAAAALVAPTPAVAPVAAAPEPAATTAEFIDDSVPF